MKLNDMSRDDLAWLIQSLVILDRLGDALQEEALQVRFDLTPGLPARVIVPELFTMPGFDMLSDLMRIGRELVDADLALMDKDDVSEPADLVEDWDQLPDTDPEPIDEIPAQVKADPNPPTVQDSAGEDGRGSIISGAACLDKTTSLPAPVKEKSPHSAFPTGDAWTEAEDDSLIEQVVAGQMKGLTLNMASRQAKIAGRSPGAQYIRAKQKLATEIRDALAAAFAPDAPEEQNPPPPPVAATANEPVTKADPALQRIILDDPQRAIPDDLVPTEMDRSVPLWQRAIRHNLTELGYPAPWTAKIDLAMLQHLFSGRSLASFAEDRGLPLIAVKDRFFALRSPVLDHGQMTIEGQKRLLTVMTQAAAE